VYLPWELIYMPGVMYVFEVLYTFLLCSPSLACKFKRAETIDLTHFCSHTRKCRWFMIVPLMIFLLYHDAKAMYSQNVDFELDFEFRFWVWTSPELVICGPVFSHDTGQWQWP
jgi:hypothetical protein